MIARLVLIAALLAAPAAVAQEAGRPASAEQIAAARARADAIIAAANAGAYFDNISDSETPLVRHRASGLTCLFSPSDPRDAINFYPAVAGGPPHGDDVGCATWWGKTFVSSFATRYPQQYPADTLFSSAVGDIRTNWQNVSPIEGPLSVATIEGQDAPLVATFKAERQGQPRTTVVVLRNIGEWSFKVRATGEAGDTEVTPTGTLAFALAIPGGWEAYKAGQ